LARDGYKGVAFGDVLTCLPTDRAMAAVAEGAICAFGEEPDGWDVEPERVIMAQSAEDDYPTAIVVDAGGNEVSRRDVILDSKPAIEQEPDPTWAPLPDAVKLCDAATSRGGTCSRMAGEGTEHEGTGRCWQHE